MKPEVAAFGIALIWPRACGLSTSETPPLGYDFPIPGLWFGVGLVLGGQVQMTQGPF